MHLLTNKIPLYSNHGIHVRGAIRQKITLERDMNDTSSLHRSRIEGWLFAGTIIDWSFQFLTRTHDVPAAIHGQRMTGDKTGALAVSQERDRLRHLPSLPGSAERVRRLGMLEEGRVAFLIHARPPVQLRDDHARIDDVDAHLFSRQLQRHAAGHLIYRRLRHVVRQHAGEGAEAVDAGNVDHAALASHEVRHRQKAEVQEAARVDSHDAVVLCQGAVLDGARFQDAGAVHEDVQALEVVHRLRDQGLRFLLLADVRGHRKNLRAGVHFPAFRRQALKLLSVASGHDKGGAVLGEQQSRGKADA